MTQPRRKSFLYQSYVLDHARGQFRFEYELGRLRFTEVLQLGDGAWDDPALEAVARTMFLLAGVSYYKTLAPPVVDVGHLALSEPELRLLTTFYREGLAEYAHQNTLDLGAVEFRSSTAAGSPAPAQTRATRNRPLVPFGGGIDSAVVAEATRSRHADTALFVLSTGGGHYPAIEQAAAVSRLPVLRATRLLDSQVLRSRELGFLNGHVPITGILSCAALAAGVLAGRATVVMSNEWSASVPTRAGVNHQYSKSYGFERDFRAVLAALAPGLSYFSALRPYSELWVAQRFARLREYHPVFRSCNRAFFQDPSQRASAWCGQCDKCCFIDLILAPFLSEEELRAVFGGREPLGDPALEGQFRALLGTGDKPFECVGDEGECRAAAVLAAERVDRSGNLLLQALAAEARAAGPVDVGSYLGHMGPHFIPSEHAGDPALG